MRIAFVGNQGNNAYRLCKWIREMGYDAHLYMMHGANLRSLPEVIDREIEKKGVNVFPSWVHNYNNIGRLWFLKKSNIATQIEKYFDIVVTSGLEGLLSVNHFHNIPLVHMSIGSEVTELPLLMFNFNTNWKLRITSFFARRALSKVSKISTGFRPTMITIAKLGHIGKMRVWGFAEDVKYNRSRIDKKLLEELNAKYCKYDRVFLWLSRLNYLNKVSATYKGPEKFLKAFKRIVLENKYNVRVIIGEHGHNVNEFRKLVTEEDLDSYIDYVPHMPYWKLLTYLSIKNAVIFDELDKKKGELSGIARESLSVGAIVVKTIDKKLIEMCFGPDCPVFNAFDISTCYDVMVKILNYDNKQFEQVKNRVFDWANKFLHHKQNIPKFIYFLSETIYCNSMVNNEEAVF